MFVEFWGVGTRAASDLPMSTQDIAAHLAADWIPSLPAAVGSSFIGWPPLLIEVVNLDGRSILALRSEVGRSERQWKSVLSWMLGVAGTRHVVALEGYRWIAPLSAFYRDAVQSVDLSNWNPSFPRTSVVVDRQPGSRSRLRPDYVVLRSTGRTPMGGPYEWAVAESKGTRGCLTSRQTCPIAWSRQARNVLVKVNGSRINIQRHLVVATRVNPNARSRRARRLQVRAWNRKQHPTGSRLPAEAGVDIAAAHLFGLFRSLRLRENAQAIALSVQARMETRSRLFTDVTRESLGASSQRAERELAERTRRPTKPADSRIFSIASIDTEFGPIDVEMAEPLIVFARRLGRAESPDDAATALREADVQLDDWQRSREGIHRERDRIVLPFGVEVRLPSEFGPR